MKKVITITTIIYVLVSLFLFVFVNINGSTEFADYVVPHINGKPVIIHFAISIVYFLFLLVLFLLRGRIKFDVISCCLLIKIFLDFLTMFFTNQSIIENIAWLAISVSAFISYFGIINSSISIKHIKFVSFTIIVFGTFVCWQVIYTFLHCSVSYSDPLYKIHMNIPYGGTNIISSFLIPIIVLCFFFIKKRIIKWLLIAMFLGCIVLTKSRGGIILGFFTLIFLLFVYGGFNKKIRQLLIIISFVAVVLLVFNSATIKSFFEGNAQVTSSKISLDSLSSGRIANWKQMFSEFEIKYVLFGMGMKPVLVDTTGAHNLLIDMIIRLGIIGSLIYGIALLTPFLIKRTNNKKRNNYFLIMLAVIIINSMFEVCYFYYALDTVFWIYAGFAVLIKRKPYEILATFKKKNRQTINNKVSLTNI